MPRKARDKTECGIYHISIRGNNKQDIFIDDQDRIEYLARLQRYKETYKVGIYAYCLMTNHVHLLVFDNGQDISRFMQGLNLSYVIYFNNKYKRSGHLFQDRFTSSVVDNEQYLFQVSRYIHLNPIKAKLVKKPEEYRWSSYCNYIGTQNDEIVDVNFILNEYGVEDYQSKFLYKCYVEENIEDSGNVQEEIASAQDERKDKLSLKGIIKVDPNILINKLEEYWGENIEGIIGNNTQKCRREMTIYLIALIARLSYKRISLLFNMRDVYISFNIKKIVETMIKDISVMSEREYIIAMLEK